MGIKKSTVKTRAKPKGKVAAELSPKAASLASALFSVTQQRVLGLLFGQPERSYYATEVINLAGAGSGGVQRELERLTRSGLVTTQAIGKQKHYQANHASPIFAELRKIIEKTSGLAEPLRSALMPFASKIQAAFVYGSIAKQQDTASSDIDLMIVSDTLSFADLYAAIESTVAHLGRAINPTIYSRKDFTKRVKEENAFITRVLAQPKIWLIGGESELSI
jgi:predicted nucleotidyltransferase